MKQESQNGSENNKQETKSNKEWYKQESKKWSRKEYEEKNQTKSYND